MQNSNLGFFWPTSKNNNILGTIKRKNDNRTLNCSTCGLSKSCKSPKMSPSGDGKKGIFVLAEFPGQKEDELGSQFVSESGQLFRSILNDFDIDLDKDCRKYYSVNCRTPEGREPKPLEIDCCRQRVFKEINDFKPKVILLLGDTAVESFFGHRWKKDLGSISKWRGWVIPDRDVNAWVIPMFHPAYILRDGGGEEEGSLSVVETIFWQDLKNVVRYSDREFPQFTKEEDKVICLTDSESINKALKKILIDKPELISFDYETTGLKPQAKGHKIVCCSISDHSERVISFPLSTECIPLLKEILTSKDIGKISHGMKFEESWSRSILGVKVNNWKWCSMLATHVLDNRKDKITSLKFQTFVNLGIADYDSHIEPYLKTSEDEDSGGNSFNKIHLVPVDDLLVYCGLDSMFTYRLALKQMKQIEAKGLQEGYDLFFKGSLAFADLEDRGICVDTDYCNRQRTHLKRRIKYIKDKLYGSSEVKEWKKIFKDKFNIDSNQQLAKILFEHLKIKPIKVTAKGNYSVDVSTLEKIDVPIVKDILEMRKLSKVEGTFLSGLQDEVVDGVMHPFFHLHTVTSFRSCVAKGIKILTINEYPDGIPIEEVKVGDYVYCFDNKLNKVIRQVIWVGKTGHRKVIRLHWESKYNHPSVKGFVDVTPEHFIRLYDGSYVCAKDVEINAGDGFYRNEKDVLHFYTDVKVVKIEQLNESVDVYDIEVEEFHNFIANGICVHNSSAKPNFQNFPVRDEQLKTIIRKAIVPRKGRQLLEVDYAGIEVRISACVHKDPKMLEYINDPSTDMHRDMAMELFLLEEDEVSKESRYCSKNGFVFPQFYGDYYESCANNIWQIIDKVKAKVKGSDMPLKEHLLNVGIKSLKQFINHVKDVEYKFWNERFAVYTGWKERHIEEYYKRGYFDIVTGFRCSGVMRRNSALNLPIQGPAFHCLLWSLTRLNEIAKKERWESQIIGQIHDSIVIDCVPNELDYIVKTAKKVMCKDIREFWNWIIVPLDIEAEVTSVDKSWLYKEAYKMV